MRHSGVTQAGVAALALLAVVAGDAPPVSAQAAATSPDPQILTGKAAFGDWRQDRPGLRRKITTANLPAPFATFSAGNGPSESARPANALPKAPPGFTVDLFASGLDHPRLIRVAPNGDIFVAESQAGRIRLLRAADGTAKTASSEIFAEGLDLPFGIAFWPPGPNPQFVYVAETGRVIRFPWRPGTPAPTGAAETIIDKLPTGGHWTRDVVFSADGRQLFVSVGSRSNAAEGSGRIETQQQAEMHGAGALSGPEARRADVLVFTPEGKDEKIFATGIRNCVGLAIQPQTSDLWCSTNERDGLGDDLPPDYVTRIRAGGFYGWPWYYLGSNEDPRHRGERPDLRDHITVPDVLIQAHSAPLQMTFYDGAQFPAEYRGDGFAALHGSWNRAKRTGYKVVRIVLKDGQPTGEYEDFLTGFVADDNRVWGRPVGVAVAHDGALLVTEDSGGTIWRVAFGR